MPKGIGYKGSVKKKSNPGNPKKKAGLPSKTTTLTPVKAKTMIKEDGTKSKAQKGFLGAVAGKAAKKGKKK